MNTSKIQLQQFSHLCWFHFRRQVLGKHQQLMLSTSTIQSNHIVINFTKFTENHVHCQRNIGRDNGQVLLQQQQQQQHIIGHFSSYSHTTIPVLAAVKELSWCAPKESRNNKNNNNNSETKNEPQKHQDEENDNNKLVEIHDKNKTEPLPIRIIQQFGIVAAMERTSRIIGINGKLPWNIPEDRLYFTQLTKNKILIIGKRTLYEILHNGTRTSTTNDDCNNNPLAHIDHVKHCIVVSATITKEIIENDFFRFSSSSIKTSSTTLSSESKKNKPFIHIAKSFNEALKIANQLVQVPAIQSSVIEETNHESTDVTKLSEVNDNSKNKTILVVDNDNDTLSDSIQCWIAGGQRIYEEAIKHPSSKIIHLTIVDTVDDNNNNNNSGNNRKNIFDDTTISVQNVMSTSTSTTGDSSYQEIAKFPPNYRWDNLYTLINKNPPVQTSLLAVAATTPPSTTPSTSSGSTTTTSNSSCTTNDNNTNGTIKYSHMVYHRKQRGNK